MLYPTSNVMLVSVLHNVLLAMISHVPYQNLRHVPFKVKVLNIENENIKGNHT